GKRDTVFFVILASNSSCIRIVDGYSFFFNGLQHFSQQLMHQCQKILLGGPDKIFNCRFNSGLGFCWN
ncbi:MAG: hypothetical protein K1Y36_14540, partial [Blastocatellia bacterium]|nr:hypothetical protein [Blastocatellia bacterium]